MSTTEGNLIIQVGSIEVTSGDGTDEILGYFAEDCGCACLACGTDCPCACPEHGRFGGCGDFCGGCDA